MITALFHCKHEPLFGGVAFHEVALAYCSMLNGLKTNPWRVSSVLVQTAINQ
jgi:hypothetical protein